MCVCVCDVFGCLVLVIVPVCSIGVCIVVSVEVSTTCSTCTVYDVVGFLVGIAVTVNWFRIITSSEALITHPLTVHNYVIYVCVVVGSCVSVLGVSVLGV